MTERQTAAPNLGSSTEQAQPAPSALRSGEMIALLAGITALGPFAMQALAPAIPGLGRSLEVSPAEAQLFLSLSTLAMAAGAVLYGPLADYYGRRPIILGGLVLAFVGATIAVLSPGYTMALVGRMVQSVGAATGMILARAVAVDRHGREGAAPVIAQMTAYMVVAPMLAPAIGGLLVAVTGWRGVFVAIGLMAVALFIWVHRRLGETLAEPSPSLRFLGVLADYRMIAARRAFWPYAIWGACSLSAFFFFVGSAPAVFEAAFGLGPAEYGASFILIAAAYMAANILSPRVTAVLGGDRAILLGAVGVIVSAVLTAVGLALGGGAAVLILGAAVNALGSGIALPNALAGAVGAAPERAGTASSLMSVVQFSAAAGATQAAAALDPASAWSVPAGMAVISVLGLFGYRSFKRDR